MKQIVEKKPEDVVSVEDAVYYLGENELIAYISSGNNPTIAILIFQNCEFGFGYLNTILGKSGGWGLKFKGPSKETSIKSALKAGREVYVLEDTYDLIQLIKEKL